MSKDSLGDKKKARMCFKSYISYWFQIIW